jgi:hypothetical protein
MDLSSPWLIATACLLGVIAIYFLWARKITKKSVE